MTRHTAPNMVGSISEPDAPATRPAVSRVAVDSGAAASVIAGFAQKSGGNCRKLDQPRSLLFVVSQGPQISGENRDDIRQKQVIAITDALFVERAKSVDAILALHAIGALAAKGFLSTPEWCMVNGRTEIAIRSKRERSKKPGNSDPHGGRLHNQAHGAV
jgi:hypothetical protein